MRVTGVVETALYVADPQRSADFYRRLFGCETLLTTEKLVALGVAGRDVLLLFQHGLTDVDSPTPGGVIPAHGATGRSHFALGVPAEDFPLWEARLPAEGAPVESVVVWPGGAKSLYVRDPDGHLVELLTPGFWKVY